MHFFKPLGEEEIGAPSGTIRLSRIPLTTAVRGDLRLPPESVIARLRYQVPRCHVVDRNPRDDHANYM
jgi:hypothetical protein